MNHKGTVRLETDRLILRRFAAADREAVFANWASDARVTEFLRWPPHKDSAVTARVLQDWIDGYKNDTCYQWAIVLKETDEPIGTISAVDLDEKTDKIHIGYCIGHAFWHRGYTSEALARVIAFFFDEVMANRIESQHDPDNPNSGKVMQKCGMRYEGTLRKADFSNRGVVDACMYALLREEYDRQKTGRV